MPNHATSNTTTLALGSLAVGVAVLLLKALAWWLTGSVALYSDALESVVNLISAGATLLAVRLSARPATQALPYGYHKVEYVSAVVIGVCVVVAAVGIFQAAWQTFWQPVAIMLPWPGLVVTGLATGLNGWWCWVLLRAGRRHRSPALQADGQHLKADVVSSCGVAAGVALAVVTGVWWLDPLLALFVAANVLWSGGSLLRHSVGGLLDVAVPRATRTLIQRTIAASVQALERAPTDHVLEVHDLRTRQAGPMTFVEFHLIVPGHLSVQSAHDICDAIEDALRQALGTVQVNIHVEPEHKAKHTGEVPLGTV
jgi:cation diffusion facilitator family transporter